jgi:segregation and condensation protein B
LTTEVEEGVPLPPEGAEGEEAEGQSDEEELREAAQTELSLLAEAARFASPERVRAVVEALLFAAEKPLDLGQIEETTRFSRQLIVGALEDLQRRYAPGSGGIVLVDLQGRFHLRTDPQVGAYVRRMLQVRPMRLTRAALETLAIVAYRQPVTRPEMEDLRGVDCGAVTRALLERKLIRILGKKDEPGRPLLYGTTREFLELFSLRDLTQLPTLREFQELSEESRKIVEEETPAAAGTDVFALPGDPAADARIAEATAESDAALDQLEKAMDRAGEQAEAVEATLVPEKNPESP